MIYLYAFVDDATVTVDDLAGIEEAAVRIEAGPSRVAVVVSDHDRLDVRTEAGALHEHDRVVAALTDRCSVAPVRFGTVVTGPAALRRELEERGGQLAPVLAELRGKVELALRARRPQLVTAAAPSPDAPVPDDSVPGGPGRRYLAGLRGPVGVRDTADPFHRLHTELASLASAATAHIDEDGTLLASYLLAADRVDDFRDQVARTAAASPDVALSLTGPWAPYSFVAGGW